MKTVVWSGEARGFKPVVLAGFFMGRQPSSSSLSAAMGGRKTTHEKPVDDEKKWTWAAVSVKLVAGCIGQCRWRSE
jgi:hypothetical protein